MVSKMEQYKAEPLVQEILEIRNLHMKLKDLIHTNAVRHQSNVPSRKELITMSKPFTEIKDHVIRLCKVRDRASAKAQSPKLRVAAIDATLSKFLRLKERGLPMGMYPDTLVTSYFADWAYRTGRSNGMEIKLNGPNDEFVQLFGDDLKRLGSGPTIKVKDNNGNVVSTVLTSVLDANGNQINPFRMNKHMFVFAPHYLSVPKASKEGRMGRQVLPQADNQQVYVVLQKEHDLMVGPLKEARKRYTQASKKLDVLQAKKDKALQVGERSIIDTIYKVGDEIKTSKVAYIALLNQNNLPHSL